MGEPARKIDPQPATSSSATKGGTIIYPAFGGLSSQPQSLPPKKAPAPHVKTIIEPKDLARLIADLNKGSILAGNKIYGSFLEEPASNSDIYEIRNTELSEDFFLGEEDTARFLGNIRQHLYTARSGEYYKKITAFQKEINKALVDAKILKEDLNLSEFLQFGISRNNDYSGREKLPHELKTTVEVLAVLVDFIEKIPVIEKPKTASAITILTFEQLNRQPVQSWPRIKKEVIELLINRTVGEDSFQVLSEGTSHNMLPIRDGLNNWLHAVFSIPGYATQLTSLDVNNLFLPTDISLAPEQLNSIDISRLKLILEKLDPILMAILDGKETPTASTAPATPDSPDGGEAPTTEEEEKEKPQQSLPEAINLDQASELVFKNPEFIKTLTAELFTDEYANYFAQLTPDQVEHIRSGQLAWARLSDVLVANPIATELLKSFLQQETYVNEDRVTQQLVVDDALQTARLTTLLTTDISTDHYVSFRFIIFTDRDRQLANLISVFIAALRQANELPPTDEPEPTEDTIKPEDTQADEAITQQQPATQPGGPSASSAPVVPIANPEDVYAQYLAAQGITAKPTADDWFAWWTDPKTKTADKIAYLKMVGAPVPMGVMTSRNDQIVMAAVIDAMIANALNLDVNSAEFKQYNTAEIREKYWSVLSTLDAQTVYAVLNNPVKSSLDQYNEYLVFQSTQLRQSVLEASYKLQQSKQDRALSELQKLLLGDKQFSFVDKQNLENGIDSLHIYFKNPQAYIENTPLTELLDEFGITTTRSLTPEEQAALKAQILAYLHARGYAAILSKEFRRQVELGLFTFGEYEKDPEGKKGLSDIRKFVRAVSFTNIAGQAPEAQSGLVERYDEEAASDFSVDPDDHRITPRSKESKDLYKRMIEKYWRTYYAANKEHLEQEFSDEIQANPEFLLTPPAGITIGEAALLANQKISKTNKAQKPTDWRAALVKDLAGSAVDTAAGAVVPGGGIASKLGRTYLQGAYDILRGKATKEAGVTAILTAAGAYAVKLFVDTLVAAATNWGAFMGGVAGMSLAGGNPIGFMIGSKIGDLLVPDFKIFGMSGPLDLTNLNLGQFGEIFNSFLANLSNFGGTGLAATAAPPATAMFVGTILSLLTGTAFLVSFIYNVPTQSTLSKSGLNRDSGDFCYPVDGIITAIEKYPNGKEHAVYTLSGWGTGSAIDIGCAFGAEIVAPFDGELEYHTPTTGILGFSRTTGADGKAIGPGFYATITSPSGIKAGFLHMVDFGAKKPPRGAGSVQTGEVIGYCNSTGNSTGNHLHYEVWGKPIKDVLPNAPLLGQPVSSRTCKNIGPTNTECFDTSGITDATKKKKVDDALTQIQGSFPGYVANVCEAQSSVVFTSQEKYLGEGDCSKVKCRYAGSRSGSITIFDALLSDDRGQSAIVYTMVHELAHQIEMGGSPLYSEFTSTVHGKEPSLLDNYRFNPSAREDFAETAAYYADTLLYGTGSPYNKYKQSSPKHFEFASQKLF
jgi:murein DD-endopeptidase MepM/ murein hydrolase activator NlpD